MNIVHEHPPIFDKIAAAFPLEGHSPIFAWGNTIYRPFSTDKLSEELLAHERVHGLRQLAFLDGGGEPSILSWWDRYINDPVFRLLEEVPAHQAEYRALLKQQGDSRINRRRLGRHVAGRLRSPLYRWPAGLDLTIKHSRDLVYGKIGVEPARETVAQH